MHPAIRLLVAASLLLLPAAARADVAPPPDYVDPCKTAELDDSCQRCIAPEFKNPGCHERARAAGQTVRCTGWSYVMYCGGEPIPSVEALVDVDPTAAAAAKEPADPTAAKDSADQSPPVTAPSAPAEAPTAAQESAPKAAEGGRCGVTGDRPDPAAGLLLILLLARRRRRASA